MEGGAAKDLEGAAPISTQVGDRRSATVQEPEPEPDENEDEAQARRARRLLRMLEQQGHGPEHYVDPPGDYVDAEFLDVPAILSDWHSVIREARALDMLECAPATACFDGSFCVLVTPAPNAAVARPGSSSRWVRRAEPGLQKF